jgi:hypothetical protein
MSITLCDRERQLRAWSRLDQAEPGPARLHLALAGGSGVQRPALCQPRPGAKDEEKQFAVIWNSLLNASEQRDGSAFGAAPAFAGGLAAEELCSS